jgi:hypothetical protein
MLMSTQSEESSLEPHVVLENRPHGTLPPDVMYEKHRYSRNLGNKTRTNDLATALRRAEEWTNHYDGGVRFIVVASDQPIRHQVNRETVCQCKYHIYGSGIIA